MKKNAIGFIIHCSLLHWLSQPIALVIAADCMERYYDYLFMAGLYNRYRITISYIRTIQLGNLRGS
jgi:hypothetical protein